MSKTTELVWLAVERSAGIVAAAIREMLGEPPLPAHLFDEAQRKRRIEAMQLAAGDPLGTESERHDAWIAKHTAEGWVYGDKFDPANKIHPNLKPWSELAPSDQFKIRVFSAFAKLGSDLELIAGAGATVGGEAPSVSLLELEEFAFSSTSARRAINVLSKVTPDRLQAQEQQQGDLIEDIAGDQRRAYVFHRFQVMSWLMRHGVPIPVELLGDQLHVMPGQQSVDKPVAK